MLERTRKSLLLVVGLLALLGRAQDDPINRLNAQRQDPFRPEVQDDVVYVPREALERHVLSKNRKAPVLLFVTVKPEELHRCHHCGVVEPIFHKMAYNYRLLRQTQLAANASAAGERLFFGKLYYDGDAKVPQLLGLRNIPSLIVFPPKTHKNFVRFEDDPGRATENRQLEESLTPALAKKKKLEKEQKTGGKAARRRQTQEAKWHARLARREKQWNNFAIEHLPRTDDGTYNEHNILRFFKRNTGIDLQLKESPPQNIKAQKAASAVFAVLALAVAAVIRLVYYPAPEPNDLVKEAQLRVRGIDPAGKYTAEDLRNHPMLPVPTDRLLPSPFWSVLFLFAGSTFLILMGGFYYNVINPSPWKGEGKKPAIIMNSVRGQYGIECYLVAAVGLATNVCFLALVASAKLRNGTVRTAVSAAALFGFLVSLGLFWAFFFKKNPWFLGSGKYRDLLVRYTTIIGKLLVGDL